MTNRGVRAARSPATTALARFSCDVRVRRSRAARFFEYCHTARHAVPCALLAELATESNTTIEANFEVTGEAFRISPDEPIVTAFQAAHRAVTGRELPLGDKPFVDDGNTYGSIGGIPALTHGPDAKGAHTLNEAVPVAELVRVAQVYALTAVGFCGNQ